MPDLKPCPFCGGKAEIKRIDLGIGQPNYILTHDILDTPKDLNYECPIASLTLGKSDNADDAIGKTLYESEQEAADSWNTRI